MCVLKSMYACEGMCVSSYGDKYLFIYGHCGDYCITTKSWSPQSQTLICGKDTDENNFV